MHLKAILPALLLLCTVPLFAQNDYFQQEVNYDIRATLDDKRHQLYGDLELRYQNNSPGTLNFIYFHLWPNAYREQTTAFAEQQLRQNKTEFFYAPDSTRGHIDSLSFTVDGQAVKHEPYENHPDIVRLPLPRPLGPGQAVVIRTPFRVQIPASFSRLGHVGQSYQMTQWYPKPAVYDQRGWHPMPYLDTGEFYSEFGTFDVRLTLPQNYWIGATGELQDTAEQQRISEYAAATRARLDTTYALPTTLVQEPFPPSSDTMKTLHYRAERVHDFAWFADKRFQVLEDTLRLPSGRVIDARVFFTRTQAELWRRGVEYVKRSTLFFSRLVGEYPYPHVTAVQSALSAGAGMEYPMITVIGLAQNDRALDEVITHEVGHNWFYGILASNERQHAWMDEGITSYYENRYMRRFHPEQNQALPLSLTEGSKLTLEEAAYVLRTREGRELPPDTDAGEFSEIEYFLAMYNKPAWAFRQLEGFLGTARFDRAMQTFYEEWQFRHPYPADLQAVLERETGEDLDWLFQGFMMSSRQMDYAITGVRPDGDSLRVQITNKGDIAAPFPLVYEQEYDEVYDTVWVRGFEGRHEVAIPAAEYDLLVIDPDHLTLEVYRKNNEYRPQSLLPRVEPLQIRLLGALENESRTQLFLLPLAGYNTTDGFLIGLGLHNRALLPRRFEFGIAPILGTKSNDLVGWAGARYSIPFRTGFLQEVELRGTYRKFGYETVLLPDTDETEAIGYWRLVPALELHLRTRDSRRLQHSVQWRTLAINTESALFSTEGELIGVDDETDLIHELSYHRRKNTALSATELMVALERQQYDDPFEREQDYVKLRLEWQGAFRYEGGRNVHWRFFGGYFLSNSLRESTFLPDNAFSLVDYGAADYRFDNLYFGRFDDGLWGQQLATRAGGFKTPIDPAFGMVGRSNDYLLALNLSADIPFLPRAIPLRPFADLGYYQPAVVAGASEPEKFLWNVGLGLELFRGRLGIYLPLFGSDDLMNPLKEEDSFLNRVSFRIELSELAPWKLTENLF